VPGLGDLGLVDVIEGAVGGEGGVGQAFDVPLGAAGLGVIGSGVDMLTSGLPDRVPSGGRPLPADQTRVCSRRRQERATQGLVRHE
jgi:hypothetical protein